MTQTITKIKKFKNWIMLIGSFFLLLCFHQWLEESLWLQGTYTNSVSAVNGVSSQMQSGKWYTQSFYCTGLRLQKMYFYFTDCSEGMGKLQVELRDGNGKKICKKTKTPIPSADGEYTFKFNVYRNLQIRKKYVVRVKYKPLAEEHGPTIKCYDTTLPILNMRVKGEKTGSRMMVKYYYNKRISVGAWTAIALLIVMIVILSRFTCKLKVNYYIFSEILLLFGSIGAYLLIELINGNIQYVTWNGVLANGIPVYVFANVLLFVLRDVRKVMSITLGIALVWSSLNYYVTGFRDKPIMLGDILAIRTAASVANGYDFKGYCYILLGILIVICFALSMRLFVIEEEKKRKRWYNWIKIVVLLLVFVKVSVPQLYVYYWDIPDSYQKQGMIAGFIFYAKNETYTKPEGYSRSECETILLESESVKATSATKAQNVIVIMNESYSDSRVINEEKVLGDLTPFMDSLTDNVIKGRLYVPVFGAGTANSEFEVLIGMSGVYVPGIPYQSLIHTELNNLCSFFLKRIMKPMRFILVGPTIGAEKVYISGWDFRICSF